MGRPSRRWKLGAVLGVRDDWLPLAIGLAAPLVALVVFCWCSRAFASGGTPPPLRYRLPPTLGCTAPRVAELEEYRLDRACPALELFRCWRPYRLPRMAPGSCWREQPGVVEALRARCCEADGSACTAWTNTADLPDGIAGPCSVMLGP